MRDQPRPRIAERARLDFDRAERVLVERPRRELRVALGGAIVLSAFEIEIGELRQRAVLRDAGGALVPENAGEHGSRFVRFSYAGTEPTMSEALERMRGFLK